MSGHGYTEGARTCALPATRGLQGSAAIWLFGLFVATLLLALPLSAAHSATYYVSTSGSDSAAGTSSAPWRTIQKGALTANPGDTVMINDGTYSESVKLDEMKKGTSPVTLQAVNSRKAIISPGGSNGIYTDYSPMQNVRFVGLKLTNGRVGAELNGGGNGIEFNNCEISGFIEGIRIRQGSNIKILDCYVHDNDNGVLLGVKDVSGIENILVERTIAANNNNGGNSDGFMVEGMCKNLVFRDCVSYGAGDTGFDCKPDSTIIDRCLAYNNNGWGIKLWGIGSKVTNSIIYGNKIDGIGCSQYNLSFIGNTFGPNSNDGLRLETSNISSCVVRNNIFYNTDLKCFASGLPQNDYNVFWNTGGGTSIQTSSVAYTPAQIQAGQPGVGSHSIGKDPLFVSAGTANYKLSSGSPCIGAGVADPAMALDYYGKTRTSPPDIGAIAYNTGTGGTVTPTAPTTVKITNGSTATTAEDLVALASGSTASSGTVTYQYQWAKSTDGTTFGAWGYTGATLPKANLADGQTWKAQARATVDGTNYSGWTQSAVCKIGSPTPVLTPPNAVVISPSAPADADDLKATVSGGGPNFEYQWSRSTDNGTNWSNWAWDNSGATLSGGTTAAGDMWRVHVRATDGTTTTAWITSAAVTVAADGGGTTTVPAPREVTITPTSPADSDNLLAKAYGGGLVSTDSYQCQWARSTDGGTTWGAWATRSASLPASETFPGDRWQARMRVVHDSDYSEFTYSPVVAIPGTSGGTTLEAPATVVITPSVPKPGRKIAALASPTPPANVVYTYQWRKSTDGGNTWGAWGYTGRVLKGTLVVKGSTWQARARACLGTTYSSWTLSDPVTVGGTTTTAPTTALKVTVTPSTPYDGSTLTANATGTYDGTPLEYEFYWSRSRDGGNTWEGWNYCSKTISASTTSKGDKWRVQGRGHNGSTWGPFVVSAPVTIR
ncbi:MAG: hypothetical protein ACYC63_10155 [Armatimonadota bacterium]